MSPKNLDIKETPFNNGMSNSLRNVSRISYGTNNRGTNNIEFGYLQYKQTIESSEESDDANDANEEDEENQLD